MSRNRYDDLDDELRAHFRMAIADRIARGESPADAERNARREFGNELLVRETTHDMWTWPAWESLGQDLKYSLRRLRANKAFTAVIVLTLALGVGVNTAIFTLVHAVMFNTLPVARPAELYRLGTGDNCCVMTGYQNGQDFALFPYQLYQTLRDANPEIANLAAFEPRPSIIAARRAGSAELEQSFTSEFVSSNYFNLFALRPALGSFFAARDEVRGAEPTVVLSYRAWQTYLGGDRGIVGSALLIKGKPFTVVGVAPPSFYGETLRGDPPDCWLPAATEPLLAGGNSLYDRPAKEWLYLMGRIPRTVPLGPLQSKINVQARRWFYDQAGVSVSSKDRRRIDSQFIPVTSARGGVDTLNISYRDGLVLLMSLSSLVLLIACANVANLLLARGTALRAQNSLKVALGASRARMLRQALTDSAILSLLGGAAGLSLAFGATRLIVLLAFRGARYVPISAAPSLTVLAFALGVSLATGLLFGIVPAWLETRSDPADALRGVSRSTPSATLLPQKLLVVAQAMLSFVLLTGAGLLTASLWNLERQHFGFRTDQRIIVKVNPAMKDYTAGHLNLAHRLLQESLSRLPGVRAVGLAMYLPLTGNNWSTFVWQEGGGPAPLPDAVSFDRVSPGYFDAIGTHLLHGRAIDETDQLTSRRVAVVNQTFVDRYCKGHNPIGMRFGGDGPTSADDYEVVGVMEDAKYDVANRPPHPTFFLPLFQPELNKNGTLSTDSFITGIVLHVSGGPAGMEPQLRKTIAGVDANFGVLEVEPYAEQVALNFNKDRLLATLTQLFGILALVLASVGLYGLVALSISRRTAEIGVRMALGATRFQVVGLILRGALLQAAVGIAIAIPLTLTAARWIEHQLFGISAHNPATLIGAVLVLMSCTTAAALIPAARAARIDPMRALRSE